MWEWLSSIIRPTPALLVILRLTHSIDMAASAAPESREYKALVRFHGQLTIAFTATPLIIANELVANRIIPRGVLDQLCTAGVNDATKATLIVKSALEQIQVCPQKYHDFMALPSFSDPCFHSLHREITAVYGAQSNPNPSGADEPSINQTTKPLEMAVEGNVTIILSGEKYSIVEIPCKSSAVVIEHKQELLEQVDMKAFVEDLGRVGRFVRVAYNGAMAAGPHFSDLQTKIQKIGFEVTDLCDASARTIAKFQDASSSILNDLQSTYEYLMENQIGVALDIFNGIVKVARTMHEAARELQKGFEKEKKEIEKTITDTMSKTSETAIEAKRKEVERKRLEEEQKHQQEQLEKIFQSEADAMEMFKHARLSQEEALKDMANVGLWGTLIGRRSAHEKRADEMNEQRKEALRIIDEQRKFRQKVLADVGEAAKKMIDCSEERENMDKAAVEALHQAEAGLRNLSIIVRQAANFWKLMEEHCSQLAEPTVEKAFKEIREKTTDKERVELFSSRPFKRGAVEFYALWVALKSVCAEYKGHIKHTQQELYNYIRESPTYDQAKHNIGKLAKEFLTDVETAQLELSEKREKCEQERQQLEACHTTNSPQKLEAPSSMYKEGEQERKKLKAPSITE